MLWLTTNQLRQTPIPRLVHFLSWCSWICPTTVAHSVLVYLSSSTLMSIICTWNPTQYQQHQIEPDGRCLSKRLPIQFNSMTIQ
jgi:hypothetical protein